MLGFGQTFGGMIHQTSGVGTISDPSDLGDLSLWLKGGEGIAPQRQINDVSDAYWYDMNGVKRLVDFDPKATKTINGISVFDFNNSTDKGMAGISSGPTVVDTDLNPFSGRSNFTVAIIVESDAITLFDSASVVSSWHTASPTPAWSGVRLFANATGGIGWSTTPLTTGTSYSAFTSTAIGLGEIVMWIGTFVESTKTLTSYMKGESANVVCTEYNYTGGFPHKQTTINRTTWDGSTPTNALNVLDILTYDKVLNGVEMNQLGGYMNDRWDASTWA